MKIEKPIFIVGSGRSGTTILYNLLALHSELCWFSNLTDNHLRLRVLAVLHRLLDAPVIGDSLKRRLVKKTRPWLKPSEGVNIYRAYCGFEHAREMTEDQLTEEMENRFKGVIKDHLRATGKPRFLSKRPANTQRIRVINRMFPDAYYIHIIRDGRAVANSLFHVAWWDDVDIWWLGHKAGKWQEMGREPVELCALHWQRDVKEILQNKHLFEGRYLEIRYEDLVRDTRGTLGKIICFCELEESTAFNGLLPESLTNMNYKWETQLTEPQKLVLNETIGEFLMELGYSS